MKLLDQHQELRKQILDYFGYTEDFLILPLYDSRGYYWRLCGKDPGGVCFADSEQELADGTGSFAASEFYNELDSQKWIYRGDGFTMIAVDEGNKILQIFDNSKERPNPSAGG